MCGCRRHLCEGVGGSCVCVDVEGSLCLCGSSNQLCVCGCKGQLCVGVRGSCVCVWM